MVEHFQAEVVTWIFGAGVVFGIFQSVRRDVRGMGGRLTRDEKRAAAQHGNTTLALMLLAKDDSQKQQIADLLKMEGES